MESLSLMNHQKEIWDKIQKPLSTNKKILDFVEGNDVIIIIDRLNQEIALQPVFGAFSFNVAMGIFRAYKYEMSQSFHSIGCNRGICSGRVGIQKIILGDPNYMSYAMNVPNVDFGYLALQSPNIKFIEVDRTKSSKKNYFFVDNNVIVPSPYGPIKVNNMLRVTANGRYDKEMDDFIVVSLHLMLENLGKRTFIQSCDKYRWINNDSVKKNQVIPFFLSGYVMGPIPSLLLMGYECAYDCTTNQQTPHDYNTCELRNGSKGGDVTYS